MMRFGAFLALLWLVAVGGIAAERVQATYETWSGRQVVREWQIEKAPGEVRFYLAGRLRATAFVKDGQVAKLVLVKRQAGNWRTMTVTSPAAIRLELQSNFYPFQWMQVDKARRTHWQVGPTRFTVVREAVTR